MNRPARLLVNSPESRLPIPPSRRPRHLPAASPNAIRCAPETRRLLLPLRAHLHSSPPLARPRDLPRRPSRPTAMDAARESSPESAAEDFVRVPSPEITAAAEEAELDPSPDREASPRADPGTESEPADGPDENSGESGRSEFAGVGGGPEPKRVLTDELAKGVVFLECESSAEGGSCDVYLVGTAHVSQESCKEVQAIINCLKPQAVFLELCARRVAILSPQNLKVPTVSEMIDMWKKKDANVFGILYSYFLAKVASQLEVTPGSEFRMAFEEARKYGAKVVLGDRPVHITLRRTWGKMTLWHKAKFLFYILFQSINLPSPEDLNKLLKDLDDVDMVTLLIQEMSKEFPTVMETLLYERDVYMSSTLLRVAREHSSVVAVVGRGHLSGIKKHWKQPVEVNHLLEIPTKSSGISAMKILASLGVAVTGVAIISGIYLVGKRCQ